MIKINEQDFSWRIIDCYKNDDCIEAPYFKHPRIDINEYLLRHLSIAITNKCNLNCQYCYKSVRHDGHIYEIPSETVIHFIQDFNDLAINGNKLETVQLIGGEPTLHNNFIKICRAIVQMGLGLRISTNGTNSRILQSRELQEIYTTSNVEIRISLDDVPINECSGPRNGDTEIVGKNIHFLVNHGADVSVKAVISKKNIDHIPELLQYLENKGVKNFSYSSLYDLGQASNHNFYQDEYLSDIEIYKHLIQISRDNPELAHMLQANILFHMLTSIYVKRPPYYFTKFYTYVNYDGNIYPQDQLIFTRFKIGNVYSYDINKVVNKLRILKEKHEINKANCLECFGYPYCTKGNYGELFAIDQTLKSDFPTCNELRNLMEYMMKNREDSIRFLTSVYS